MSFFSPPAYSLLCLILSLLSLGQGSFVLIKNHRATINRSYFLFCVGIFLWLFPIALLSTKSFSLFASTALAKIVFIGVNILPCAALHFTSEFLGSNKPRNTYLIVIFDYIASALFIFVLIFSNNFITGVYEYSWGYFPKGGIIHVADVLLVMSSAIYAVVLLMLGLKKIMSIEGRSKRYHECKAVLIAFIFVTMAGTDFLHNWGIDFFPVGSIFVTLFLTFINYAIFKHKLLGISVVLRSGIAYSILVSMVTALYFLAVYVSGMLVGDLTRVHSPALILVILALITFLFRPIEKWIHELIDKLFVIKPREIIEKENLLLLTELQKQDRMKAVSALAAGMAHEIKNPLTSIKTFAEFLPKKYDDIEFRNKFSKLVIDEVDRVNSIVQQLLDFSKPTDPILKLLKISETMDETLSLLSSNLIQHKISLNKDFDSSLMTMVDKNQLKQAFLNLLLNSIQSMSTGGTLTIGVKPLRSKFISIIIQDTGAGINSEHLNHIFDPFYTTKEGGTGLGLAIVHSIITKHGGKIDVQSTVGVGTTVTITLKRYMQ